MQDFLTQTLKLKKQYKGSLPKATKSVYRLSIHIERTPRLFRRIRKKEIRRFPQIYGIASSNTLTEFYHS